MCGAKSVVLAAVAIGCWGVFLAGVPGIAHGAAFPAVTMRDETDLSGAPGERRSGGLLHHI